MMRYLFALSLCAVCITTTFAAVDVESEEPSMRYVTDPFMLKWKLDQLKSEY